MHKRVFIITKSNGFEERLARIQAQKTQHNAEPSDPLRDDWGLQKLKGCNDGFSFSPANIGLSIVGVALAAFLLMQTEPLLFSAGPNSTRLAAENLAPEQVLIRGLASRGMFNMDMSAYLNPGVRTQIEQNQRERAENGKPAKDDVVINGINLTALGNIYNSGAMNASRGGN